MTIVENFYLADIFTAIFAQMSLTKNGTASAADTFLAQAKREIEIRKKVQVGVLKTSDGTKNAEDQVSFYFIHIFCKL